MQKKNALRLGSAFAIKWVYDRLSGRDFCRTRTLRAAADFKRYFLAVFEGGIAVHFNFRVVDKEIFAAVFGCDESVAFFGVEPFYISCAHITCVSYFNLRYSPFAGICEEVCIRQIVCCR